MKLLHAKSAYKNVLVIDTFVPSRVKYNLSINHYIIKLCLNENIIEEDYI